MKALIKITTTPNGQVVSARELHKFLEASERFSNWIDRQFQYGFEEGLDYIGCKEFNTLANQELNDFALTLDCAKEISMLQKSEKGKQARKYFIECEKNLKNGVYQLPKTFSEALRLLADTTEQKEHALIQLNEAKQEIEANKPKVLFANTVSGSSNSILVRQFAKDLCNNGFEIGQNRLFQWFRDKGYLNSQNEPYQNYVSQGLFEVITRTIGSGEDTFTSKTTKITGKGQVYFSNKLQVLVSA